MLHFSLEIKLNHYPAFLETKIEILRLKKEKLWEFPDISKRA
jgi:hypothetical protein